MSMHFSSILDHALKYLSELSDDDSDDASEMSPEDRKAAQDKLVAPLAPEEWGEQNRAEAKAREEPAKNDASAEKQKTAEEIAPSRFEAEHYEGASEDEEEADEDMMDEHQSAMRHDEDGAQIIDEDEEAEVDMDQEMEDFLKFTREALGLTQEQYADILKSRSDRGGEQS